MKRWLLVPAIILSGIAILLAVGVGRWKDVGRRVYHSWITSRVRYETHLSPTGTLAVVRRPRPLDFHHRQLKSLPVYSPQSAHTNWHVNLRGYDLSQLDVSDRLAELLHADFDSKTRWPTTLPASFDWKRIMELGKDPGLRVRQLHARGITGKGVGIGMIDQTLLVDHVEYGDRLRLYEEIHHDRRAAQMHGPAVASIALGKTVGVAPGADLYYIAETHGEFVGAGTFNWDVAWLAKSINRLLDVNAILPRQNRIRVISMSVGWQPVHAGYAEVTAAVNRAKKEGVFVISTSLENTHNLAYHGLGRESMADPNTFAVYAPGLWWAESFWRKPLDARWANRLLVPMDVRCTASPTGAGDYVFYTDAGWSWCVPWIAGLYALACEVRPEITPEQFWAAALKTGETIRIQKAGVEVSFGPIANPVALIENLQHGK